MNELSKEERAYRRGALQAIQFLKAELSGISGRVLMDTLAVWEEALVEGRGSLDPEYLGTYLDTVRDKIIERCNREFGRSGGREG